jgi:hypothetical protein
VQRITCVRCDTKPFWAGLGNSLLVEAAISHHQPVSARPPAGLVFPFTSFKGMFHFLILSTKRHGEPQYCGLSQVGKTGKIKKLDLYWEGGG